MEWISRGRSIGQNIKNAGRLGQILTVFARHGFADVAVRMGLDRFIPKSILLRKDRSSHKTVPQRLRESFEELGPTFVKFGQLLSTRPDVLPEHWIEELTKLQDNVLPIPFEQIKKVIEEELEQPIDKIFDQIDEKPLASASISQVHRATLNNGDKVVVKVQRPGIAKQIRSDVSLLETLAVLLERHFPEAKLANPTGVVDEFFRTLTFELDFMVEANNISKISANMVTMPEIVIPKVYRDITTQRVLTLEELVGIRVNDLDSIDKAGIDRKYIVRIGSRAFFKSVMVDGLFHGDLHGGNLFILPGNKIGLIDFGIVGRLSQKSREQLANMFIAIITEDFEHLAYQYAELGAADPSTDFDGFQRELRNTVSPYMGLNLSEVNSGRILIEATKIATKYRIRVPGEWMIVFKAILTMEGMGRTLDPQFDMMTMGQELAKDLVKNQYSMQRLSKDLIWISKDLASLLQVLPRQIRWMFKKFNSNDFAFEIKVPEIRKIRDQLSESAKRQTLGMCAAGLFIASSLSLDIPSPRYVLGYPILSVIYFSVAVLLLLHVVFR